MANLSQIILACFLVLFNRFDNFLSILRITVYQFFDFLLGAARHHILIVIHSPSERLPSDYQAMPDFHHFLMVENRLRLMEPDCRVFNLILSENFQKLLLREIQVQLRSSAFIPLFFFLEIQIPRFFQLFRARHVIFQIQIIKQIRIIDIANLDAVL